MREVGTPPNQGGSLARPSAPYVRVGRGLVPERTPRRAAELRCAALRCAGGAPAAHHAEAAKVRQEEEGEEERARCPSRASSRARHAGSARRSVRLLLLPGAQLARHQQAQVRPIPSRSRRSIPRSPSHHAVLTSSRSAVRETVVSRRGALEHAFPLQHMFWRHYHESTALRNFDASLQQLGAKGVPDKDPSAGPVPVLALYCKFKALPRRPVTAPAASTKLGRAALACPRFFFC